MRLLIQEVFDFVMKHSLFRFVASATLAAGLIFAQAQSPGNNGPAMMHHRQWNRGQVFERFASQLNLTDAQKQQAKAILDSSKQSAQPIVQQLQQDRKALRDAVQSGKSESDIDQLSNNLGTLTGQLTAIHTKAMAKIYALLTPEQRTKAQTLHNQMRGMFMGGHEHGQGGGTGY